jgi:hypothetical protein
MIMQFISKHLKLTRQDVRKMDAFKNFTDWQADEIIRLVYMLEDVVYAPVNTGGIRSGKML